MWQVGRTIFFEKNIIFRTLLGWSGGGPGGLGRSGEPVGLEKLVDSMTWRISPSPRFGFRPVFFGSGSARLVRRSKNAQKTEDNARFDSKNAVFCAKNG